MKPDFSGLQSRTPHFAGSSSELGDVFSPMTTFQLPNTTDFDGFQKDAIQTVKPAKGTTHLLSSLMAVLWWLRIPGLAWEAIFTRNLLAALETINLLMMGGSDADAGRDSNKLTNKTVLVQQSEESKKMDEDNKIIEELRERNEYQKVQIAHLEKALNQAIARQKEVQ